MSHELAVDFVCCLLLTALLWRMTGERQMMWGLGCAVMAAVLYLPARLLLSQAVGLPVMASGIVALLAIIPVLSLLQIVSRSETGAETTQASPARANRTPIS